MRIALLGPPQIVVDTRKAVALLAYVAIVDRPVARESLAELLWPESEPEDARGALRRTLSVLRAGLGGSWLRIDRRQVVLEGDDIHLDVATFRGAVRDGLHVHASGDACPACRVRLSRAVDFFRGDFLEGFSLRDSAPFDEWQMLESEALRTELADALRRLLDLEVAEARPEAVATARRQIALDPLDEAAHRSLMRVHAAAGDRAALARHYRSLVLTLERELGVGPAEETTQLHDSLLRRPAPEDRADAMSGTASLGPVARAVLSAAAILGRPIDPDIARDVADVEDSVIGAAFDELVARGVLVEPVPSDNEVGYRFADDGVRVSVLAGIGLARRRQLERRAARAIRSGLGQSAIAGDAGWRLARHLVAANEASEAAEVHRAAAEAARRDLAHADAAAHLRAALQLSHSDRPGLLADIGDVETLRGRYGEALAAYEQGAALAGQEHVAAFEHRLGGLHLRRGALELADLHLAAALARLGDEPSALRARVLADRSLVAVRRHDRPTANRLARSSLREARMVGNHEVESQAENLLAMLARRSGDLAAARRHLRRSVDRAGLADHPGARIAALNHLALLERTVGNLDDALALTEEALRRCELLGDRHREAALRNNRADLLHALGRPAEAAEELVRSVTAFAEVGEGRGLEPEIWKLVEW